jgi:hypothetical protein
VQALLQDEVVCRWKKKDLDSLIEKLARAEAALGATWVAGLRTRGTRLADADVAGLAFGSKAAN